MFALIQCSRNEQCVDSDASSSQPATPLCSATDRARGDTQIICVTTLQRFPRMIFLGSIWDERSPFSQRIVEPSIVTRIAFLDFDAFADAIESMLGQFMPIARSTEEWWVQSVTTGRVLTQTFQIGGPASFAGDGKRDQIALQVPLTDATKIRIDGRPLEQDSFLLIKEGQPFTLSTSEATRWPAIVVPTDHEFLNPEFVKSQMSRLFYNKTTAQVDATAEHIDTIRFLVARLSAVADSITFDASAARCAEKEIIATVSRALETSSKAPIRRLGRPSLSRAQVIARTLALLEASTGAPLFTVDLCRATGVAERTLRNIFREYFGIGQCDC
jgi:AraC family transcriptional regulator, ethanolamine operon transcriptional activator